MKYHFFRYIFIYSILLISLNIPSSIANTLLVDLKPQIQLATHFRDDLQLSDFLVSEKLDGVRGYWNGSQLLTKSGRVINAPTWFTADFPKDVLDGELWMGLNQFEQMSGLARTDYPDEEKWRDVKFMIFDLPNHKGSFELRYQQMLMLQKLSPYIQTIPQQNIEDSQQLHLWLDKVVAMGGEGLMLHRKNALYQIGRSPNIVKLKPKFDAEAEVIGYTKGKGKYKNMMGALIVKMPNGKVFKIGSGFSDAERSHPPEIGQMITYQYLGLTQKGTPRFATFLRVRDLQ